jgi:hypothetical protein
MEDITYEFDKGNKEIIRATVSDFAGKRRADLRVYFKTDDGAWRPTKRGVSLPVDMVGELQKAVTKLAEVAE